jgi:hypothetical protein
MQHFVLGASNVDLWSLKNITATFADVPTILYLTTSPGVSSD